MWITRLKIGLFALLLITPLLVLLLYGSVAGYGGDNPDFPRIDQMLRGKKGRMDRFGNAVLHRSVAMKVAIELRNWVSYRLVAFVDTRLVVSGTGDWLFYRPEFQDGRCIDADRTAMQLRKLRTLIDFARASGIDMIVSLSPDKSTIYPEELNRYFRGYWRCRSESAAILRRLIKQEVPALIDHAEPLLAEKTRHPDIPLYYATDTHWTPYAGAFALRQLLAVAYPALSLPPPRLSGATSARGTDLSAMLMLPVHEPVRELDPLPDEILRALAEDTARHRTVIGHDSFYRIIEPQVRAIFPGAVMVHLELAGERLGSEALTADRLIINLVERSLLGDIQDGPLTWSAPMPRSVLARNRQHAGECSSFRPAPTGEIALAEDDSDETTEATWMIPIRQVVPPHLPCLRLSMAAHQLATLELALPNPATGDIDPGRFVEYRIARDDETVGFVLPAYAAGSSVRVRIRDSDRPVAISLAEIGEIDDQRRAFVPESQP